MICRRLAAAWSMTLWAAAAATAHQTVTAITSYWAARLTGYALDPTPPHHHRRSRKDRS